MSWPSGYCADCGSAQDYKYSWGYEKPHGLDYDDDGILRCDKCRKKIGDLTTELSNKEKAE